MSFRDLYDAADDGLLTPRAASGKSVPRSTYHRLTADEDWKRPFRGTALLPGTPADGRIRLRAAVAAVGAPVAVTGWSAAYLRGLVPAAPTTVEILVPVSRRPRRDGLLVRRTRAWDADALQDVDGMPVVGWPRMVADLAERASEDWLIGAVLTGFADRRLNPGDLQRVVADRGRFPGRGRLRRVADRCRPDGSESGFEHRTRGHLTGFEPPPDDEQAEVAVPSGIRRIDIPWGRLRVGIECHSWRWHGSREAFESDAGRRNDLLGVADWIVLDLTWRTLELHWPAFRDNLQVVLARRAAALDGRA